MTRRKPYELIYDPEVRRQVSRIDRKYHSLIRWQIERQLRFEPEVETRNRKPILRPSVFSSAWELRFGPNNRFRVFYRTNRGVRQVYILAVRENIKDRLFIGGEEFEL
jgi:mRNA-degrading endonuclease RelE of RelBE toxin-antitoxin system